MDIQPFRSGKVRDVYEAGENLIIVASDRISAFDCILPTPIPDKPFAGPAIATTGI